MNKIKKGCNSIFICEGKKCCRYNEEVKDSFELLLQENQLVDVFSMEKMKCQGMCKKAPIVYLSFCDKYKKEVGAKKVRKIFEKHML